MVPEIRTGIALTLLGILGGGASANIALVVGVADLFQSAASLSGWRVVVLTLGGALGTIGGILGLVDTRPSLILTSVAAIGMVSTGLVGALPPALMFGTAAVLAGRHAISGDPSAVVASRNVFSGRLSAALGGSARRAAVVVLGLFTVAIVGYVALLIWREFF